LSIGRTQTPLRWYNDVERTFCDAINNSSMV